jgi:hypothetical protein
MNPLELYEAYSAVYAPQQIDELSVNKMLAYKTAAEKNRADLNKKWDNKTASYKEKMRVLGREEGEERASQNIKKKTGKHPHEMNALDKARYAVTKEDVDIFDVVLEFLYVEGYAKTLEEAEWMMANIIDEEAIAIVLGEAITSEKGKAKAAEMIAARSTPSGRAKSGQGANVAQIKHIGRANVDGKFNTPPNEKVAKNPVKSTAYLRGSGNKAARRAGTYKEEFELWVNELVEEGYDLSDYTWEDMLDIYEADSLAAMQARREKRQKANMKKHGTPGFDYSKPPSGKKGYLDAITKKEEYVDESQHARENPEKYEREQAKKSAPVRGERTPMPPRGDKRREDFEKWYAKNVR